ncbi:unannotated protein [freshwater metagenome]|uniref:Unannotated protein n=1 Tax=freshwater metagenome TaxID=449393 RepID=A0A6J6R354_9ZZZZ
MKVVSDINEIKITVTIFTVVIFVPRNVSEIGAPKNFALAALTTSAWVNTPCLIGGVFPIPFRTVNSEKNIGAWARIGKHEASGFVLCSL